MLISLLSLLSGDLSRNEIASVLVFLAAILFVMFVSLPVHESAHALVAHWLGDDTGRLKGRITLNPFAHLTLWGVVMMLVIGVGYARPVPVNIRNFKNRKLGFAITSLAGPVSNVLMSLISVFIAVIITVFGNESTTMNVLITFFFYVAVYNFSLALFNMIPIPPFDGSRLITLVLPNKYYYKLLQYERYFIYIIIGLVFITSRLGIFPSLTGISERVVNTVADALVRLFI